MPKQPINYDNTIIYKIQHVNKDELLYVGHTTEFTKRKSAHKSTTVNEKGKAYNRKLYEMIRTNGGWDMFRMLEVKTFPCSNRREAEAEEDLVMRTLKATMNINRAFLSEQDKKANAQKYRDTKISDIICSKNRDELLIAKTAKQKVYADKYIAQNNRVCEFLLEVA
jgi:hypothetical protein